MDNTDSKESLDYLYKEYTRLSDRCDSYAQSAFEDIKLYGAIAVLLAWKPIADAITVRGYEDIGSGFLLFGFIGILLIVGIIAVRDLLKQSVIKFYFLQLSDYEAEIRKALNHEGNAFRVADNWSEYNKRIYLKVFSRFFVIFSLLSIAYPCLILATQATHKHYALIYLAVGLLVIGIYISAGNLVTKGHTSR